VTFCLGDLSIGVSRVLKSSTINYTRAQMHEICARVGLPSSGAGTGFPLAHRTWASLETQASSRRLSGRICGLISTLCFYYYRLLSISPFQSIDNCFVYFHASRLGAYPI
jgi:hypothetical protein